MSAIGDDCVRIFDTFGLRPDEESDVAVIRARFEKYFTPKSCITYERYNFNKLVQNEEEPFDSFVTRVREQAKKCSFSVLHDSLVKDRIIIGVNYSKLVPQLLNDELTLQKVIDLCRNHELTTKQLKVISAEEKVEIIKTKNQKQNKSESHNEKSEIVDCGNCGWKHKRFSCPAYGKECHSCARKGHFASQCRAKKRNSRPKSSVNVIENEEHEKENYSGSEEELFIGMIQMPNDGEDWFETVKIKEKKFSVKLDTGAHCNVLPLWLAKKLELLPLKPSSTKCLVTFSKHKMPVLGEVTPLCLIKDKSSRLVFKVVEDRVVPVLGRKACITQQLIARGNTVEIEDNDVYDGLGCVKNYIYDIDLIDSPVWEVRPDQKLRICIEPSQVN